MCADGKVRPLARISATADTFFRVPAAVRVQSRYVSGYVSLDSVNDPESVVRFHANTSGRNAHLLARAERVMTTGEDLDRQVNDRRATLERAYKLMTEPETADVDAVEFLVDNGADADNLTDANDVREAAESVLGKCLSVEGIWKGPSRDSATLTSVVVVFRTGGPRIELDTAAREVRGYWGNTRAFATEVDAYVCAYYEARFDLDH